MTIFTSQIMNICVYLAGNPGDTVPSLCRLLLRSGCCSCGIREEPEDRREGSQDDQYPHSIALRVLFTAVLSAQERDARVQDGELGGSSPG